MSSDAEPHSNSGRSPWGHLKAAVKAYLVHDMTDRAAALTYFAMVSLFPGLLLIVSITVLLGDTSLAPRASRYLLDRGADESTAGAVRNALDSMLKTSSGAAGATFFIGLALSLNGASAAFGAAGRALNTVHSIADDRSFVHRKSRDLGWTAVVLALLFVTLVSVVLGGRLADDIFGTTLGLGQQAASAWAYLRWPLALLAVHTAFEIVYTFAPDLDHRRLRWFTPGSVIAVGMWLLASVGLNLYVSNFSSYGAAYGTFGAAIVLLLWLYVSANAFLFGAELDKTIERTRTAGRGGPPLVTPPPTGPLSPRAGADTASRAPGSPHT